MNIIDISVPIHPGMTVFEGDPVVDLQLVAQIAQGDLANVSSLSFGVHTGTHLDAPRHFIDGGGDIENIPLSTLVGSCLVVDATALNGPINAADVQSFSIPAGTERIILKTRNSNLWNESTFSSAYIGLNESGANAVVDAGIRLIGIDYLSIATPDDPGPAHVALLSAGVVILEGLNLRHVEPGTYTLVCLPLRLTGTDGAPARALLMQQAATGS